MKRTIGFFAAAVLFFPLAACSGDDAGDEIGDAVDSVQEEAEDALGSAGARASAEALRSALVAEDLAEGETLRDVAVLEESVDDLPNDPDVSGIEDADGDGKDDDGMVEIAVGDPRACVTVTDNGETTVTGEACQ